MPARSEPVIARRRPLAGCLALAVALFGGGEAQAAHIRAVLEAETVRPASGGRVTLALSMTPERGWHGYWRNPGDAGAAASIAWTLPPGVSVGPMRYPVPGRFLVQGLMNYVYERPYALLMTLSVPEGLARGTRLTIGGKARWLACSATLCVPEQAVIAIDLVVGDGTVTAPSRARFDGWRARLPVPLVREARFERQGKLIRISIPFPKDRRLANPYFFPATDRVIDHAAPQYFTRRGGRLIVEAKAKADSGPVDRIEGVLTTGSGRGQAITARFRTQS